jgi:hypothetical protein
MLLVRWGRLSIGAVILNSEQWFLFQKYRTVSRPWQCGHLCPTYRQQPSVQHSCSHQETPSINEQVSDDYCFRKSNPKLLVASASDAGHIAWKSEHYLQWCFSCSGFQVLIFSHICKLLNKFKFFSDWQLIKDKLHAIFFVYFLYSVFEFTERVDIEVCRKGTGTECRRKVSSRLEWQ